MDKHFTVCQVASEGEWGNVSLVWRLTAGVKPKTLVASRSFLLCIGSKRCKWFAVTEK